MRGIGMFTVQGGVDGHREGPSGESVFGEVPTRRRHPRTHQHSVGLGRVIEGLMSTHTDAPQAETS